MQNDLSFSVYTNNSLLWQLAVPSPLACLPVQCMLARRKIKLIEGNAKCHHLKILTYKGTLRQVFISLRSKTPYPHLGPLHPSCINYLCTYDLYSPVQNVLDACISITRGSGRGWALEFSSFLGPVKWHRVPFGANIWTNMSDCMYLHSINSNKHPYRSIFCNIIILRNYAYILAPHRKIRLIESNANVVI
jgi:hypothetical protein